MSFPLIEKLVSASAHQAERKIKPVYLDRNSAGELLADVIKWHNFPQPVLFSIPAGGIPVAIPVAERLKQPLHLVYAAKIRYSSDTRYGIGALGPNGNSVINQELMEDLPLENNTVRKGILEAGKKMRRAMAALEKFSKPVQVLTNKTAIIIDDGVASGYTALTAAEYLKKMNPQNIIIAAPIATKTACERIQNHGYTPLVLTVSDTQPFLVDCYYRTFPQLSLEDVSTMLSCT